MVVPLAHLLVKRLTTTMFTTYFQAPIGRCVIEGNATCITSIRIDDQTQQQYSKELPDHLLQCVEELEAYFEGKLEQFTVPLEISSGTPFQQKVWQALQDIPYGRTVSYLNIAEKVANKKTVRAVGRCVGGNPIGIIIPCHRVIGSNGKLTGFAYGLENKRWLLELEQTKHYGRQRSLF